MMSSLLFVSNVILAFDRLSSSVLLLWVSNGTISSLLRFNLCRVCFSFSGGVSVSVGFSGGVSFSAGFWGSYRLLSGLKLPPECRSK